MGKKGFRQLRHTADIYIEAYGQTIEEAFEQAGHALFRTIIPEASGIEVTTQVTASGADMQELLYDWLEKLLHVFEIQQIVGTEITVNRIVKDDVYRLEAEVAGVMYDREKHKTGTAVKSPTYALMEIDTQRNTVRFVLDI